MPVQRRVSNDRFVTSTPGVTTWHSFSFGAHYDPGNVGLGPLVAHNDEHLDAGAGYPDHPHRDTEIVTLVLDGVLRHAEPGGVRAVLAAGTCQVQSAGSGIVHSEVADPSSGPTRFVQAWVRPDEAGTPPARSLTAVAAGRDLVPLASGRRGDAALRLGCAAATLWLADAPAGAAVALPDEPLLHVFEAATGDAWRITDEPGHVHRSAGGLVVVWSFRG